MQEHHFIEQQTLKLERSRLAILRKQGRELTPAQERLLMTPLSRVLSDRRNLVRINGTLHHRSHGAARRHRIKRSDLHPEIDEFACEYALEAKLEKRLEQVADG